MATAVIKELSREEVKALCKNTGAAGKSGIGVSMRSSFSEKLNGKKIELVFDDIPELLYEITNSNELFWSGDNFSGSEYCQILELGTDGELFLVNHLRAGTFPLENISLVLDFKTGLCTIVRSRLGDAPRPRDVESTFHFGYIKNINPQSKNRHRYTDELVHKIIDWHYDNDNIFIVKHLYVSREHMVYYLCESDGSDKGLVEAAECSYIKIRDDIYIMSWLEKGHQGMQGTVLMDLKSMHDVGSFFGISIKNVLDSYTFEAMGEFSTL